MECLNINIKEIKDLVDVYGEVMTSKILDYFPEKIPTAKEIQELANNGYFKGIDVNSIMSISLNNKIDTSQQQGRISKKSKFSPVLSSETLPYLVELRDLEILRERLEGTTNEITYKDSRNNKAVIFEGDIYTYENYQLRVNGKPMTYAIFDEVIERVRERKNDIINHFKVLKSNLLRDIYENDDSYYKSLSDLLLNHIDKLSENPVTYKVYNNPKTGGQYDYGEDRLTLAMYNEYIFLHELIHNFTSLTLYKIDYGLENSMDGLLGNKLEIDFYRKIHELYQLAKRRTNDKNLYGYKNIHEFVAEAFTSKKFQEDLRLINLGEKANYTTWQRLLDILTNHLGYMTNKSQRTVLDETISITLDYITKSPYIDRNFDTININKDLNDAEGFLAYFKHSFLGYQDNIDITITENNHAILHNRITNNRIVLDNNDDFERYFNENISQLLNKGNDDMNIIYKYTLKYIEDKKQNLIKLSLGDKNIKSTIVPKKVDTISKLSKEYDVYRKDLLEIFIKNNESKEKEFNENILQSFNEGNTYYYATIDKLPTNRLLLPNRGLQLNEDAIDKLYLNTDAKKAASYYKKRFSYTGKPIVVRVLTNTNVNSIVVDKKPIYLSDYALIIDKDDSYKSISERLLSEYDYYKLPSTIESWNEFLEEEIYKLEKPLNVLKSTYIVHTDESDEYHLLNLRNISLKKVEGDVGDNSISYSINNLVNNDVLGNITLTRIKDTEYYFIDDVDIVDNIEIPIEIYDDFMAQLIIKSSSIFDKKISVRTISNNNITIPLNNDIQYSLVSDGTNDIGIWKEFVNKGVAEKIKAGNKFIYKYNKDINVKDFLPLRNKYIQELISISSNILDIDNKFWDNIDLDNILSLIDKYKDLKRIQLLNYNKYKNDSYKYIEKDDMYVSNDTSYYDNIIKELEDLYKQERNYRLLNKRQSAFDNEVFLSNIDKDNIRAFKKNNYDWREFTDEDIYRFIIVNINKYDKNGKNYLRLGNVSIEIDNNIKTTGLSKEYFYLINNDLAVTAMSYFVDNEYFNIYSFYENNRKTEQVLIDKDNIPGISYINNSESIDKSSNNIRLYKIESSVNIDNNLFTDNINTLFDSVKENQKLPNISLIYIDTPIEDADKYRVNNTLDKYVVPDNVFKNVISLDSLDDITNSNIVLDKVKKQFQDIIDSLPNIKGKIETELEKVNRLKDAVNNLTEEQNNTLNLNKDITTSKLELPVIEDDNLNNRNDTVKNVLNFSYSTLNNTSLFNTDKDTIATFENLTLLFPDAVVVRDESELSTSLQETITNMGATGQISGFFHKNSGNVYLIASNIKTIGEAEGTYRHELIGHKAVQAELGLQLGIFARYIVATSKGEQRKRLEQITTIYHNKSISELNDNEINNVGQEYIAYMSENPNIDISNYQKLKTIIKNILRKFNIKLDVKDYEIIALLRKVERNKSYNKLNINLNLVYHQIDKMDKDLRLLQQNEIKDAVDIIKSGFNRSNDLSVLINMVQIRNGLDSRQESRLNAAGNISKLNENDWLYVHTDKFMENHGMLINTDEFIEDEYKVLNNLSNINYKKYVNLKKNERLYRYIRDNISINGVSTDEVYKVLVNAGLNSFEFEDKMIPHIKELLYYLYPESNIDYNFYEYTEFDLDTFEEETNSKLIKLETVEDVEQYRHYYAPGETLCTFNDIQGRLDKYDIWVLVNNDINDIERSNTPDRYDDYSTSLVMIQRTKPGYEDRSDYIISRYNHTVNNPNYLYEAVFDNLYKGLSMYLQQKPNKIDSNSDYIVHYDKIYKFETEIEGVNYYYNNNGILAYDIAYVINPNYQRYIGVGMYYDNKLKNVVTLFPDESDNNRLKAHTLFSDNLNRKVTIIEGEDTGMSLYPTIKTDTGEYYDFNKLTSYKEEIDYNNNLLTLIGKTFNYSFLKKANHVYYNSIDDDIHMFTPLLEECNSLYVVLDEQENEPYLAYLFLRKVGNLSISKEVLGRKRNNQKSIAKSNNTKPEFVAPVLKTAGRIEIRNTNVAMPKLKAIFYSYDYDNDNVLPSVEYINSLSLNKNENFTKNLPLLKCVDRLFWKDPEMVSIFLSTNTSVNINIESLIFLDRLDITVNNPLKKEAVSISKSKLLSIPTDIEINTLSGTTNINNTDELKSIFHLENMSEKESEKNRAALEKAINEFINDDTDRTLNDFLPEHLRLYNTDKDIVVGNKVRNKLPKTSQLILPIGISGSGKSTWISTLDKDKYTIISPDEIRKELVGNVNDQSRNIEIFQEVDKRMERYLLEGKKVVLDATNINTTFRRKMIGELKTKYPNLDIRYKLLDIDPNVAKQRIRNDIYNNINRSNTPDEIIDKQYADYLQSKADIKDEPIYEFNDERTFITDLLDRYRKNNNSNLKKITDMSTISASSNGRNKVNIDTLVDTDNINENIISMAKYGKTVKELLEVYPMLANHFKGVDSNMRLINYIKKQEIDNVVNEYVENIKVNITDDFENYITYLNKIGIYTIPDLYAYPNEDLLNDLCLA